MIKGFRDFVLRGNVIDLAIAVVIGAAFAALVSSVVNNFIQPIINVVGSKNSGTIGFSLRDSTPQIEQATLINISGIISSLITFALTAAVVYFAVVVPMNKLLELRKRGQVPEVSATPEDIALLQEIRDLLAARGGAV